MSEWIVIGVPSSAGAHHAGQDLAPDALHAAGLADRMRAAGETVHDAGNLAGARLAAHPGHPRARNLGAVVAVARQVADAVAGTSAGAAGRDAASGRPGPARLPLVIGGDCTITLGVMAGFRRRYPDVGLVYVDGDTDLSLPGSDSGILDSMVVSHLLGRGAPELAGLGGTVPLLDPARLAILGPDPRETADGGREWRARGTVSLQEAPALCAYPVAAATRALAAIGPAAGPVVIHFDVDVIDSGDLPLGNFPHYGSGVRLEQAAAALAVLRAHPAFAGLVLTEVNPTHDSDGSLLRGFLGALVPALSQQVAP